ncbi:MAG: hypothetical protein JSS07_00855 [Proteobacteria bacterium]|nr:hypothetical protein [Pseudomonadota bacterium]
MAKVVKHGMTNIAEIISAVHLPKGGIMICYHEQGWLNAYRLRNIKALSKIVEFTPFSPNVLLDILRK